MAEATVLKRKKKVKDKVSREVADITEGIPEVSDLKDLLQEVQKNSGRVETEKLIETIHTNKPKNEGEVIVETTKDKITIEEGAVDEHENDLDKDDNEFAEGEQEEKDIDDVIRGEIISLDKSEGAIDVDYQNDLSTCTLSCKTDVDGNNESIEFKSDSAAIKDDSIQETSQDQAIGGVDYATDCDTKDSSKMTLDKDVLSDNTLLEATDLQTAAVDVTHKADSSDSKTAEANGTHQAENKLLYPDLSAQLAKYMEQDHQLQINDIFQQDIKPLAEAQTSSGPDRTADVQGLLQESSASAPPASMGEEHLEEATTLAGDTVEKRPIAPPIEEPGQVSQAQQVPRRVMPQSQEVFQPLTRDQLSSLYYNVKLENLNAYIDKFIQTEMKKETHEFYEILMNYQRARKHLLECEAVIQNLEEEYRNNQMEVWITETCTTTVKGTCGEGYNAQGSHTFKKAKLDYNGLAKMTVTLKNIQEQVQNELSLHSYSAQLSKLQVESYIHDLLATSPDLRDIPKNLPVSGLERQSQTVAHQVRKLSDCLSILFYFHRLPIEDAEMVQNLQQWTERMVSVLLRVACFEDHMFLLNHLMRCPSGIGAWASHFVQAPLIPTNEDVLYTDVMFGNPHLDHVMAAMATILIPASFRAEFMIQMQKMLQTGRDNPSLSWVMIDSDGEEDDDPQHTWMYLHENDVVTILKQLPLSAIFRHIFFVVPNSLHDGYEYDIKMTSESTMYRVFAFSTCLVGILGNGLKTYSMSRYRQLNKRLGRMIRQCVQLVSDHWENFKAANEYNLQATSLQKLQAEYDAFFLRAVNLIHISQRLGSWQYIADMPFTNVTKETMWRILWLLHQSQGQGHDLPLDITFIPPAGECCAYVKDPSCHSQLSDILQHVSASEGVYLLNAMTNMTQCCSAADVSFIETVTISVFEVSFICPETRDISSKMGRELLAEVVKCHPFILSVLVQRVNESLDKLGQMGIYFFKGLPLSSWLPTDPDLAVVRQWLLTSDLSSPANQMAQQILMNIHWGNTNKGNRLMVPWRIHKQVAVLVVEAYQRFIHGKHLGSMIMEGVKQMSAAVQQYQTTEQEFHAWCWNLLHRLVLHWTSLPSQDEHYAAQQGGAPDLNSDDSLLPLVKGVKEKNPTACYVALMVTKMGQNVNEFLSEGIRQLEVLTEQGLSRAIVSTVYYTLRMFVDNQKYILDSIRFQEVVLAVLHADESYFKVVKGLLSYDFPGPITKLFTSMILSQMEECGKEGNAGFVAAIDMWTRIVLQIPKWHLNRNCCCVLDHLIKAAFTNTQALQRVQKTFTEYYKKFCQQERGQGMVSSILTWVTSGIHLPSFMDKLSGGEFCWLAYIVLCLEGSYEVETRLWPALQEELLANPKAGTEQCLKKSIMKLKLDQAPVWGNLNIVRWANKALDMPEDHPVAVLVWQRFFGLYLGRLTTNQSTVSQRATVGERFFSTIGYSSYPKKMRKKLGQVADHYVKLSSETVDEDDEDAVSRKELHYRLSRLFQTFQLWVEEPLLHDATLYLPSLPIQYLAEKLLVVFQNHTAPWLEYLDLKGVSHELEVMTSEWKLSNTPEQNPKTKEPNETEALKLSGKEQILLRLSRMEEPLPPPPVPPIKPPVPEMSPGLAENKSAILHLLEADLTTLREYAGNHCAQVAGLKQLDEVYIDKVTRVFQNVGQQVTIEIRCSSMINPLHKCAKPGAITTWVDEKWTDKTIQRNVDENRAEYKQRLIACKVPFSKNTIVAAVHTENAITMLVKMYRGSTDEHRRANLCSIGCNLFFRMGEVITDSILQYPPTKQFFASCIDILGKEFVQCELQLPDQVLAMVLERQEIGGLLSPHFKPNLSPQTFVRMYGSLVQQIRHDRPGPERDVGSLALQVAAMLLSKFDMLAWLGEYSPSRQEVKTLIEHLSVAFIACGLKPELHYNTLYQVYLIHEKKLLQYRFPMYLHEVLAAILQGSSIRRVCVQCWEVLHSYCFHSNDLESRGHSDVCTMLSLDEIRNLMTWLGFEFMQMRLNVKQTSNFGLYSKWQPYVTYIARLLRDLSKCLLDKMLPNIADANTNDGLDMVWKAVVESYCPWIQTVTIQKVGCVPWIDSDRELAAEMVQSLTDFVAYAQCRTEDIHHRFFNDFLSLLWLYFATTLCVEDAAPTVVAVYNTQFAKLPWQQMVPNLAVMETMTRLKETGCSMGFNLVTDIMAAVGWKQVMEFYETHYDHNRLVQFEGCFFLLLIQAFSERKHIESPEIQDVMTQAQVLEWKHLSANDFKRASSWLLQSCDPKWLLLSRTSLEVLGLRIAETAAGFNTSVSAMLTEEWTTKRLGYLHCLSSLICQFTYVQDMNPASLSTVVLNLLTQIETVESAVVDTRTQIEESTDMLKEILSLLNNSNPDNKGSEVIMEVIMDWLRESPQTILLSPCIRAASRNLASLTYMVRIVEHCIELSFVPGANKVQTVDPWSHILSALQVPELNLTEFFMACVNESSFLLLYSFLLQQVPLRQTLSEQQGVIEMVCDWTERAKPSSDNESKLLLWWFQAVDLILRQIDHGRDTVTCVMLIRKLMNRVKGFGEDRASEGLLGAIGFGRKSQLSERFRVCSRAFVAFCSLQIAGDSSLRLKPEDPASSVPAVKLDVNNLLSIKTNKKYQPIRTQVDRVCEYVNDQSKCLRDAIGLLAMLKELFYADKHFLSLIES